MQQLKKKIDHINTKKNEHDHIVRLVFFKNSSKKILKINFEILIINCTYKTNRFKMFLFVIIDQTILNIIFYMTFVFIAHENKAYYTEIFIQLQWLYRKLNFFDSTAIIINCKSELFSIMRNFWSIVSHFLYIWHININVLTQCRKKFDDMKTWNKFYNA